MHIHVFMCVHVCPYTYVYACIHKLSSNCTHIHLGTCTHKQHHAHMSTYPYTAPCTYTQTSVHKHPYIQNHALALMHIPIRPCAYVIHPCTYTHTYTEYHAIYPRGTVSVSHTHHKIHMTAPLLSPLPMQPRLPPFPHPGWYRQCRDPRGGCRQPWLVIPYWSLTGGNRSC